jgi:hypothetical protein
MNTHALVVSISALLAAATLPAGAASADTAKNWPQWRGPLANGIAPQGDPPTTWSETENVKWKVKVPGRGMSTPIVWENQVFLQTAIPTGRKVEPAAEEKKEAANFSPNVLGQAAPPVDAPPRRRWGRTRRKTDGVPPVRPRLPGSTDRQNSLAADRG